MTALHMEAQNYKKEMSLSIFQMAFLFIARQILPFITGSASLRLVVIRKIHIFAFVKRKL